MTLWLGMSAHRKIKEVKIMGTHTECYEFKCSHLQSNKKCKFGWKTMAGKCPAPLASGIAKLRTKEQGRT